MCNYPYWPFIRFKQSKYAFINFITQCTELEHDADCIDRLFPILLNQGYRVENAPKKLPRIFRYLKQTSNQFAFVKNRVVESRLQHPWTWLLINGLYGVYDCGNICSYRKVWTFFTFVDKRIRSKIQPFHFYVFLIWPV